MEASWIVLAIISTKCYGNKSTSTLVTELPEDHGYGTIMIYVDQFSKMVVLVLLCETNTNSS